MTSTPFCPDCPDHEACGQSYPCELVKRINSAQNLHEPWPLPVRGRNFCRHCDKRWPCPTWLALTTEATPKQRPQHFQPANWRPEWGLYMHLNERSRAEHDRGTPHRPFWPWNETSLLRYYQGAFAVRRR